MYSKVARGHRGLARSEVGRGLRDNGLSLTLFALFVVFIIGQALAGQHHFNEQQLEHGQVDAPHSETGSE